MDMKPLNTLALDPVGVIVTTAVVPPEPYYPRGVVWTPTENRGEVERIELALPEDDPELISVYTGDVELSLTVSPLRSQLEPLPPIRREELSLL